MLVFNSARSLQEIWATAENVVPARTLESGVAEIDAALGGGLACGRISEVYGGPGTGKTQLALTLVAEELITNHINGGDGIIIYFHTTGTFPIERLCEIIEGKLRHHDGVVAGAATADQSLVKTILGNLGIDKVVEPPELILKLLNLSSSVDDPKRIRLLVLDSIASVFRPLLRKRGHMDNFSSNLLQVTYLLKRLAYQLQMSVLVLNEVIGGGDGSSKAMAAVTTGRGGPFMKGNRMRPALGDLWTQSVNCRVAMHHKKNMLTARRFLQVTFNVATPPTTLIPFVITSCGVEADK